jgi:hypothetical protein
MLAEIIRGYIKKLANTALSELQCGSHIFCVREAYVKEQLFMNFWNAHSSQLRGKMYPLT